MKMLYSFGVPEFSSFYKAGRTDKNEMESGEIKKIGNSYELFNKKYFSQ